MFGSSSSSGADAQPQRDYDRARTKYEDRRADYNDLVEKVNRLQHVLRQREQRKCDSYMIPLSKL